MSNGMLSPDTDTRLYLANAGYQPGLPVTALNIRPSVYPLSRPRYPVLPPDLPGIPSELSKLPREKFLTKLIDRMCFISRHQGHGFTDHDFPKPQRS